MNDAQEKPSADYADYTARLRPQNKLNSLRYLGVLWVSAVFPGLSQTLNELSDWAVSSAVPLECFGTAQGTPPRRRERRGNAES